MNRNQGLRRNLAWRTPAAYCLGGLVTVVLLSQAALALAQDSVPHAPPGVESPALPEPAPAADIGADPSDAAQAPATGLQRFVPEFLQDGPIATGSMFDILLQGGWLMIPLAASSFILLVFVFERLVSLRQGRIIPRPFVKRFMHQLREGQIDREAALAMCLENGSPVALVFAHAVRKWGRPAVEVEQAVMDAGERAANLLRKHLRVINGVATVSPLLGLLGTVTGMIEAFNTIATSQAMGRPEMLAGGISEALLTTAAGLSVAIPALIFYMYFVGRVDQLIVEIDALGQDVVHQISAEAAQRPSRDKTRVREAA